MDRLYELENRRRSLAMLPQESAAMKREEALELLRELEESERRLRRLRAGLMKLLDESGS